MFLRSGFAGDTSCNAAAVASTRGTTAIYFLQLPACLRSRFLGSAVAIVELRFSVSDRSRLREETKAGLLRVVSI